MDTFRDPRGPSVREVARAIGGDAALLGDCLRVGWWPSAATVDALLVARDERAARAARILDLIEDALDSSGVAS